MQPHEKYAIYEANLALARARLKEAERECVEARVEVAERLWLMGYMMGWSLSLWGEAVRLLQQAYDEYPEQYKDSERDAIRKRLDEAVKHQLRVAEWAEQKRLEAECAEPSRLVGAP